VADFSRIPANPLNRLGETCGSDESDNGIGGRGRGDRIQAKDYLSSGAVQRSSVCGDGNSVVPIVGSGNSIVTGHPHLMLTRFVSQSASG
jgi:hypothetical protein